MSGAFYATTDDVPDPWLPTETEFWSRTKVRQHIEETARCSGLNKWGLLACVLARVCAYVPARMVLPGPPAPSSPNLIVGLVGKSGSGKSSTMDASRSAFHWPQHVPSRVNSEEVEEFPVSSGEGIAAWFREWKPPKNGEPGEWLWRHTTGIGIIDEVDSLNASAEAVGSKVISTIRTAWSGGILGQQNATQERRRLVPALSYRLPLLIGVQHARAGVILDDKDGGTPQRVLWAPASFGDSTLEDLRDPPTPLRWRDPAPRSIVSGGQEEVPFHEDVKADSRRRWFEATRGIDEELDAHANLTRKKVATLLAYLDGDGVVTMQQWLDAALVMDLSDRTRNEVIRGLARARADLREAQLRAKAIESQKLSEFEREHHIKKARPRVVNAVIAAGEGGISRSMVRKKFRSGERWIADIAIDQLRDEGRLIVVDQHLRLGVDT